MLVRFVVARPQALRGASLDTEADASLHAERRRYDDLVLYAPRVTPSRLLSPLVGLLEWLRYASTHLRHVHFIAKCDDDVYIWPPELFSILSRVRTQPHVYLGRFFFTTWNVEHHGHNGSSYAADTTAHEARQCLAERRCHGPFPFTTGSLQLLSTDLAVELATSDFVNASIGRIISDLDGGNRSLMMSRRQLYGTVPVYEDAWMGYAISELLPPSPARRVCLAMLHQTYTFDDWGFGVRNTSVVLHWKLRPETKTSHYNASAKLPPSKLTQRMRLTDEIQRRHHCPSAPTLSCDETDAAHLVVPAKPWRSRLSRWLHDLREHPRVRYIGCMVEPSNRTPGCGLK